MIDLNRSRSVMEVMRSTLGLYGSYPWLLLILALGVMALWDLAKLP